MVPNFLCAVALWPSVPEYLGSGQLHSAQSTLSRPWKSSLFLLPWSRRGLYLTSVAEWTTTRRRAVTMTIMGHTYSTGQMALAGLAFALQDW